MMKSPILILTFVLGLLVLGPASADSPLVAPGGDDSQAQIDWSNASFEEAPIVIAGAPRIQSPSGVVRRATGCCRSNGTCENMLTARCTMIGGTPRPVGDSCTTVDPTVIDPVCGPEPE